MNKELPSLRKKTKRIFHIFAFIITLISVESLINADDFQTGIQASQITGSTPERKAKKDSAALNVTSDATPASEETATLTTEETTTPTTEEATIPTTEPITTLTTEPITTPTTEPTTTPTTEDTQRLTPTKIKNNLKKFGDKYLTIKPVKSNKVEIRLLNEERAGDFITKKLIEKGKKKTQVKIDILLNAIGSKKKLLDVSDRKLNTLLQKKSIRFTIKGGIIPNELYRTRFQLKYPNPSVKSSSYRYFCGVQLNASKLSESNGSATVQFKLPKEIVGVRTIKIKLLDDKKNLIEKKSIKNKSGSTKTFTGIKKNIRYYYTCEVKTSDKKQEKCTDLGLGSFIISTGNQAAKAKGTAENVEQSFIFRIASDSEMMY